LSTTGFRQAKITTRFRKMRCDFMPQSYRQFPVFLILSLLKISRGENHKAADGIRGLPNDADEENPRSARVS
jgi:hypothetical protein